MKLMIISDIHGSATRLETVLERMEEEKPDKLIISGDILYHGPRNPLPEGYEPKKVIDMLNDLKDKIIAVRGNCDSEVDQMVLNFPILGDYQQLYINEQLVFISHGHLYENRLPDLVREDGIYIQGHTHVPVNEEVDGRIYFNPGSIALPKEGHEPTYGIYESGKLVHKTLDGRRYELQR